MGRSNIVADVGTYGLQVARKANLAAGREGTEQTDAIGEGLAAVAFALLEVAAAIRENTEARS
ncbi:hypothetical protein ABZ353_31850 [Streptomyces niveus]|uniref:hypothetical protein n=1 Tax=Streptomyces niveus TaxID=193462 RepID=UPI0033CD51F0